MSAASRLFALVVVGYALSSGWMPDGARALLGLIAVVSALPPIQRRAGMRRMIFGLLFVVIAGNLAFAWTAAPNHHWVMSYVSLAFALHATPEDAEESAALRLSFARLITGLMGLAVLQKLASQSYVDGSYFAHIIDTGALGGPAWTLCSGCEGRAELNVDAIVEFVEASPQASARLEMTPVFGADASTVWRAGRGLALAVLLIEVWLACVYALAWRHKAAPLSILAFAVGLVALRAEWVFGSLVCALAFAACEPEQARPRQALALACLGFIALRLLSLG